ncbi:hypothetical protein ACLKA7_015598 [Drosophila subpalustris]
MSHSIRRTYGPQPPQLSLENSSTLEEQCMRDDRYFNLLYKAYDNCNYGITQRINSLGSTDHFNANRSTLDLQRNENNKAWRSSLIDYRQMDAELARIQRDCETIENNLARVGISAQNDNRPKVPEDTGLGLNLVGSALSTVANSTVHVPPAGSGQSLNSPSTPPSSDLRLRCHNSGTMTEISSSYQLPTIAELVRNSTTEVPTEGRTFQQEVRRQLESNSVPVAGSNPEPYRCPVCWNCVRQRKPASTTCGHVFCSSCIKSALRTTCKCPVCQRLMTTRQLFRIYI